MKQITDHETAEWCCDDIHQWFGLSYANYMVLNRSVLQSMPGDWQHRFVEMLEQLQAAATEVEEPHSYRVQAVDEAGRFIRDPVPHYNRGRTRVPLRALS